MRVTSSGKHLQKLQIEVDNLQIRIVDNKPIEYLDINKYIITSSFFSVEVFSTSNLTLSGLWYRATDRLTTSYKFFEIAFGMSEIDLCRVSFSLLVSGTNSTQSEDVSFNITGNVKWSKIDNNLFKAYLYFSNYDFSFLASQLVNPEFSIIMSYSK